MVAHALSPAFAGLVVSRQCSQGSVRNALHPGLYAAARLRGLKTKSHIPCKDSGNDKGFPLRTHALTGVHDVGFDPALFQILAQRGGFTTTGKDAIDHLIIIRRQS